MLPQIDLRSMRANACPADIAAIVLVCYFGKVVLHILVFVLFVFRTCKHLSDAPGL